MSEQQEHPWRSGEDVQMLDNALADAPIPNRTRRALIERASGSLLALGGAGALLAACGSGGGGGGKSSATTAATTTSPAGGSGSEIKKIIDTAITAEALAVTYLSAVIKGAAGTPVAQFTEVLKAANAAEYDHYKALKSLGAQPLTTKFWAPHAFFGHQLKGVFPTLEVAETLFVNAYLIAITEFAKAGKPDLVRYASEIAGVEAQHLALARYGAGKLPNDVGFADYSITSIDGIVAALEKAGVGFGTKGTAPGRFVTFSPPGPDVLTSVNHTSPQ
jgi:hypothetical protein